MPLPGIAVAVHVRGAVPVAVALVAQAARGGEEMRAHVERVEAVLRQRRERARERRLDERGRLLAAAGEAVAEAEEAALVRGVEKLERRAVASLHAASQYPALPQLAPARLVLGDRHRLENPS